MHESEAAAAWREPSRFLWEELVVSELALGLKRYLM